MSYYCNCYPWRDRHARMSNGYLRVYAGAYNGTFIIGTTDFVDVAVALPDGAKVIVSITVSSLDEAMTAVTELHKVSRSDHALKVKYRHMHEIKNMHKYSRSNFYSRFYP